MQSLRQSYYLRKAGEDLFDVSLLAAADGVLEEAGRLAGPGGWQTVVEEWSRLPWPIRDLARDLSLRVRRPEPRIQLPGTS